MKKLIIISLLSIPLLGFGQSAGDKSVSAPAPVANEVHSNYSTKAMASTFTSNSLNQQQVNTFQDRSIQKLKDFYNYLTIISNPKFDKRLRENVKTQAKQLFYGPDCKVNGKIASDFIDSCFNLTSLVEWKAIDIGIYKNMASLSIENTTGIYQGELSFKESVNGAVSKVRKVEIVLSKSQKQFGDSKQDVWTVFICSIE